MDYIIFQVCKTQNNDTSLQGPMGPQCHGGTPGFVRPSGPIADSSLKTEGLSSVEELGLSWF